jgi:hypothetical protein
VDPHSLNPDPDTDPAFQVNPDRIQSGSRAFDDQKLKKKIQQKKKIFLVSKIAMSIGPCYRRSLQSLIENIQHFKNVKFFKTFFSILVGHFCPPESGSGSTALQKAMMGEACGSRHSISFNK